jgi:hypothetical protein
LFVCLFGVPLLATGATIDTGERVSRIILRFAAFSSAALILKGIYFHEKRKTEIPGHPTLPKNIFFLTRFHVTVQSKRSAETVDRYTAQVPLCDTAGRCV